jgi:hypothetical protein
MANKQNPTTFTITDSVAVAQGVTGFNLKFGKASGAYTLTAPVPAADLTTEASGTISGKLADLNLQLAAGTWYVSATAVSGYGESKPGPEDIFDIVPPPPDPPTGFTVA